MIFIKLPDFNEIKEITDFNQFLWNNALMRTFQMNRFQGISCLIRFQRRYIFLVKNINFSKQMLYRLVYLYYKITRFQCFGLSAVWHWFSRKWTNMQFYWFPAFKALQNTVGKAVNRASFVWSIWSKNFPVETIWTKINTNSVEVNTAL